MSKEVVTSHVAIIGAGLAGLAMACELKRRLQFNDFVIYERDDGVGGTWHHNRYPGAAVDIPGCTYQLSFFPEPNFSCVFPSGDEMRDYISRLVKHYNLQPHLRLKHSWERSYWLDDRQCWRTDFRHANTGKIVTHESKVLISATGHLVNPKTFEVPGIGKFRGQIVHAARWSEGLEFADRNVVVLGNGSTAVQVIPAILEKVRSCVQIQKHPQWILDRPNPPIPAWLQQLFTWVPLFFSIFQHIAFIAADAFLPLLSWRVPKMVQSQCGRWAVPERFHKLLTPSYEPGCKRLVFASQYWQCLANPKLDLTEDEISSMDEDSVTTATGARYPCELLILAHGFESESFTLPVYGRNGVTPEVHWEAAGGPSCYKGTAMHDFPNFFMLRGPNLASGHNSVIYFIEASISMLFAVATPLFRGSVETIEIRHDAELAYARKVQAACKRGVWGRGCSTYYVTRNGWNHTMYPWSSYRLWFHRLWRRRDWIITKASAEADHGCRGSPGEDSSLLKSHASFE